MYLEEFQSGKYVSQYKHKSFIPEKINHSWNWENQEINVLFEEASRGLGGLNSYTKIVPNIDLFIQMHIVKEANISSKIEGTRTNLDEVLLSKENIKPQKRDDWQEVNNYIRALKYAINELGKLPVSNRLIKKTHKILLTNVRGKHKSPGKFRKSQNWIGGSSLKDAVYIPPPDDYIGEYMSDLEKFIHNDSIKVPHLIKIAIIHYQFETIHPFLDGNGRIGRLLIILYLISNNLLDKPSLYLSDFFEKNRASYYDALSRVRESNDLIHWIKFFLNGVIETTSKGRDTFEGILKLQDEVSNKINSLGRRAGNAKKIIDLFYMNPLMTINDLAKKDLNIHKRTIRNIVKELIKLDLIKEHGNRRKNKLYFFKKYFKLFL
ncbi:MAG: Fic family protein [Candidatus Mcinerneyibacterium aminivorans]|uniref:Fic family protein n=1 Tax=Candidatus Mcinerneyibacterium aminivorans TaxID=2703815 RepID=A0A5D0ME60_9BACT|nr:MAG: Fic family protein [Candidatus Mcinerneyibacterium aminivorans]